jgi:lipoprotein-releasing system ATP-binding protein
MLIAKNIKKSFGDLQVLKGINLEIKEGEVVSIVGKSGTGKSTLLHILGTLDDSDEGSINIAGQEINDLNSKQLAKFRNEKLGFIFQFHHLLNEFTALENVMIPAMIAKTSKKETTTKAKELLAYFGLSDRLTHKPNQLSGGEQQRVAVARALINDPKIIFADEPSGNLDNVTSEELHNLIFKLRTDFNQSFVIVTHNQDLAKMSDRSLIMEDGLIKI